jgi:hypothetical protein
MRRRAGYILLAAVLAIGIAVQASIAGSSDENVLEFDTMAPVVGPFVGGAHPIRGVPGGGLPWQIAQANGELRANGALEIEVHGLVLLNGDPVPPDLRGTNPIPSFRGLVSCRTIKNGHAATRNVSTGDFPASRAGDAEIRATIRLPNPCFAPIVFVTSPTGLWFAVTGR